MTKTTITGWSVPQVEAVGNLQIPTNHPRGFLVINTVTGQVQRGARHEFALRTNLRKEDAQALVQVANRIAKEFGIAGVAAPKPLPKSITVPGNGTILIEDMSDEALLFAIAFKGSLYNGAASDEYKALVAEKNERGL